VILKLSISKLLQPLIRLIIIVGVLFVVCFSYAGGYDPALLPGLLIIICIPVLPTIYLLIEYFVATNGLVTEIGDDYINVKYRNGGALHYTFDQIEIIKLFKSAGMEKGSIPFQTAERYYHAEIFTKDGKKIILTSVLNGFDNAMDKFEGLNIDITRTVYSTIYI
jgi:hypothetical protein